MTDPVSLPDFWDMLSRADWTYEYSDDHSVWRRGRAAMGKLTAISKQSDAHAKLMADFYDHVFSGKPWNTEKKPRPERPDG